MALTVHLIRHGQTSSYDGDAGLTELGAHQSSARGRALADVVADNARVAVVHAPTERARLTADHMRRELLRAASENDRSVPRRV